MDCVVLPYTFFVKSEYGSSVRCDNQHHHKVVQDRMKSAHHNTNFDDDIHVGQSAPDSENDRNIRDQNHKLGKKNLYCQRKQQVLVKLVGLCSHRALHFLQFVEDRPDASDFYNRDNYEDEKQNSEEEIKEHGIQVDVIAKDSFGLQHWGQLRVSLKVVLLIKTSYSNHNIIQHNGKVHICYAKIEYSMKIYLQSFIPNNIGRNVAEVHHSP